MLLLYSLISTP